MNNVLFHSAPALTRELTDKLANLLDQLSEEKSSMLRRAMVVEDHERPKMVFTGQYSSGKSTLIKALTDGAAQVVIDSAVATGRADTFDWDGLVDLVDTPGVQAGLEEHDGISEAELRVADLVLFTVTVDLFDDRLVEHLRHVTETLQKGPQVLIVITKCRSVAAAQGVREAAVRDALGSFADLVPWVECDAKTYLEGLREVNPSKAARRIAASKIEEVKSEINRIARERGALIKFRIPLQQVALVASEALALMSDDADEEAILTVLARQRTALTNRQGRIDSALRRLEAEFRAKCIEAAEWLADVVERVEASPEGDWAEVEAATEQLNGRLASAHASFTEDVKRTLATQLLDLTSEVREIESSPYARHLTTPAGVGNIPEEDVTVHPSSCFTTRRQARDEATWTPKASDYLKRFHESWGAGDGVRAAAGTPGHRIIYRVGKSLGVKFKPYQAVRLADNIGKVVRVGGVVLPIAFEAYAMVREEREEVGRIGEQIKRRRGIVGSVLSKSDEVSRSMLNDVRAHLSAEFGAAIRDIDEVHQAVQDSASQRGRLSQELAAVRSEALDMLSRLSVDVLEA